MDPVGLVLAVPGATSALLLLVVLPGITFGPILAPGRPAPLERLGRDVAAGLLVTSATALALALLGLLRPTILVAALVALTVLPLHGRRPTLARVQRLFRRGRWRAAVLGGALLLVGPALLAGPHGGLGALPGSWAGPAAARAVASAGSLSVLTPAWGGERLVVGPDLPGVAHLAAALQLLPTDVPVGLALDRVALAAIAVLVTAMLLRRWLGAWAAVLGGGLFVGVGSLATPLFDDPTATRSLVLAVFALWLADRALVERSNRLAVGTAVVGAIVLLGRFDAFLAVVAGICGLSAARWLVAPGGGPENAGGLGHRHGRRLGLRSSPGPAGRVAVLTIAVATVLTAGAGVVAGGLLRATLPSGAVLGAASAGDPGFVAVGEVPAGWTSSGDEGWDFWRAVGGPLERPAVTVQPGAGPAMEGGKPPSAGALIATALLAGLPAAAPDGLAIVPLTMGLAVILPIAAWPLLDQRRQRLVVAWLGFALVVGALGVAGVASADGFLEGRTVTSRLLPLAWLLAAAGAGFAGRLAVRLVAAANRRAVRRWGPDRMRPAQLGARPAALAAAGVLAVAASFAFGSVLVGTARSMTERPGAVSAIGAEAYAWIARHTPLDARILANGRTDGVIGALGGRSGVIDGPEIDPRDEGLLARATGLALGARVVFLEPGEARAAGFAAREGVSHLLVAGPGASPTDLGAASLFAADLHAIVASPRYALVRSFGERVWLFAVLGQP